MKNKVNKKTPGVSRRDFIKASAAVSLAALISNTNRVFAGGCAGRGTKTTSCSEDKCAIEIMGATNVLNNQNVILDFDLKQFTFDTDTNTVTAKVVLDADGSHHKDYAEMKDDDYELK